MALLNYANLLKDVTDKYLVIGITSDSAHYPKLHFTGDGHIVTHGVDLTPDFGKSIRGLVKGSNGNSKEFLRGNNSWATITTSDLPMASAIDSANTSKLPTVGQIINYVANLFTANDAMRFKGTITQTGEGTFETVTSKGTIKTFPQSCEVGDTYRVTKEGHYLNDGKKCSLGDLLICIKKGSGSALNTTEYWTAIESNINGFVTNTINGSIKQTLYSNDALGISFYAPTTGGTEGLVLFSKGNAAPVWEPQSKITAGHLAQGAIDALLQSVTAVNGQISVKIGNTTKTAVASGTWGINITGLAGSVKAALTAGAGVIMESYNGSTARTISLKAATTSIIGGIIVDGSEKPTLTIDSKGILTVTKLNVINALGFVPGDVNDTRSFTTIVTDSVSNINGVETTGNPFFNLILTIGKSKSVVGNLQFTAGVGMSIVGKTSVSQNTVTIALNEATTSARGGILIYKKGTGEINAETGSTGSRYYGVQLDSKGRAFVNVPWVNTQHGIVTKSVDGIVPKFDAAVGTINSSENWVLTRNGDAVDWYKLPANAFKNDNDWRPIFIGDKSIEKKTLKFVPTGDVYIKTDSNEDGIEDISFGLSWYNISSGQYETA